MESYGLLASVLSLFDPATLEVWMTQAFYPVLLGILVIASLGLPIPEDIPLIAAGVVLKTHPQAATWTGTLIVAMIGIMSGDLVLYSLGRFWARDLLRHKFIRWLLSPERFELAKENFHRRGAWYVFFGRFVMGVRAVMCITAGATHYPYWRFFLADFAGALLSVPFFVVLGYLFAGMIPTLKQYIQDTQTILLVLVAVGVAGFILYRMLRKRRTATTAAAHRSGAIGDTDDDAAAAPKPVPATLRPSHPAPSSAG